MIISMYNLHEYKGYSNCEFNIAEDIDGFINEKKVGV